MKGQINIFFKDSRLDITIINLRNQKIVSTLTIIFCKKIY